MKSNKILQVCTIIFALSMIMATPLQAATTTETSIISADSSTSATKTTSTASKTATTASKKSTKKSAKSIFSAAKSVGKVIAKNKFKYGKSSYTNLKASIKKKRSFCADYVTWALQKNGDLSTKYRIYGTRSGGLAGSGRKAVLKYYKKINVNKKVSKVRFKPGDIVCVNKISGKFGWHMMIFAKYNKHGKPMWYSGGRDATIKKTGRYSKYKLTTARRLSYYEKANTAYILRRK